MFFCFTVSCILYVGPFAYYGMFLFHITTMYCHYELTSRHTDREAQRAIRERTRNQIERLEKRIQELEAQKPYQDLQVVVRAKEAIEAENAEIKRRLATIITMLEPIVGTGKPVTPSLFSVCARAYISLSSLTQKQAIPVHHLSSHPPQHLQLPQSRATSLFIPQLRREEWPLNRLYKPGPVLVAAHRRRRRLVELALPAPLTRALGLC